MKFLNSQTKFVKILSVGLLSIALVTIGVLVQDRVLKARAAVQVLLVSHIAIPFGTVFPGEEVSETYTVQLDSSVGAATYFSHLEIVPDKLDLCPFLVITPADIPVEPGDTFATSTLVAVIDGLDKWQVQMSVPAIEGHVAQDHDGDIIVYGGEYACKIVIETPTFVQGCSPGYWKQEQHFDNYPQPPHPNTSFVSVFGENAFPGKTLLQVMNNNGGGLNALGRIIVSAYLSSSAISDFPYTPAQVISDFQSVYPGNNNAYNTLKNKYEALQDPCPLD